VAVPCLDINHGIRGEFNMVINHSVMEHKKVPWQMVPPPQLG